MILDFAAVNVRLPTPNALQGRRIHARCSEIEPSPDCCRAVRASVTPIHALVHGSRALGEPRSTSWPSWRRQVHDLDMKSSVHPKYKTKYHVGNWPAYDRALVRRDDIPMWLAPDAIDTWEAVGVGTRGGPLPDSDLAIETALPLRLIVHLPCGRLKAS